MEVEVRNNDLEGALKILRNKISKDGILKEVRVKEFHMTRAARRRKKDQLAARKKKRAEARRRAWEQQHEDKGRSVRGIA